jgi:hypothetical protein
MDNKGLRRGRLRWVLVIGALLVVAAAAYVNYFLYLPIGHGPAGPSVDLAAFENVWTDRQILLVGIGDSVTAGLGASRGKSYFDRLVKNPADEFDDMQKKCLSSVLPNLKSLNISVSGSNSLQHQEHIRQKLSQQESEVFGLVVMTTGGNDLIHWYGSSPPHEGAMYGATLAQAEPWIANYEQRLDAMFREIQDRFPGGCAIFVADIYDPSDGVGDPESTWVLPAWPDCLKIVEAYNTALRRVAAKYPSVHVVPVNVLFLGHGIHCRQFWRAHYDFRDPHYWYYENIEDPNDRGYDALRRAFLVEISAHRSELREQAKQ